MSSEQKRNLAILLYGLTLGSLLIYSFSQIDLNLTLSGNPWYQAFQHKLILLGYYERPTSTVIYLLILLLLFAFQMYWLKAAKKGTLSEKTVWKLSLLSASVLLFSYPAFSHDIFNYIFDTRLLITHHVNPWQFTALDFPLDLWTRFMRWTHRTYPYGPLWLIISLPFSYAGMAKFVPTLLLFKLMFIIVYFLNVYFIYMLNRTGTEKTGFRNSAFFALNPLVITETLVSPHNESIMLF